MLIPVYTAFIKAVAHNRFLNTPEIRALLQRHAEADAAARNRRGAQ